MLSNSYDQILEQDIVFEVILFSTITENLELKEWLCNFKRQISPSHSLRLVFDLLIQC